MSPSRVWLPPVVATIVFLPLADLPSRFDRSTVMVAMLPFTLTSMFCVLFFYFLRSSCRLVANSRCNSCSAILGSFPAGLRRTTAHSVASLRCCKGRFDTDYLVVRRNSAHLVTVQTGALNPMTTLHSSTCGQYCSMKL